VPIVATLHRESGCKFVTLHARLGASRDTVSETLASLIGNGVVMRNPGYGHPMRPEYVLTPAGADVGEACIGAVEVVTRSGTLDVALKKWPMIVLIALGRGGGRFNELKEALPGITPRALAGALRDLADAGLADRTVTEDYPPSTFYRLTPLGRDLLPAMEALARACERVAGAA
jgi:DNA-binding HxlR family transcriptional regulator